MLAISLAKRWTSTNIWHSRSKWSKRTKFLLWQWCIIWKLAQFKMSALNFLDTSRRHRISHSIRCASFICYFVQLIVTPKSDQWSNWLRWISSMFHKICMDFVNPMPICTLLKHSLLSFGNESIKLPSRKWHNHRIQCVEMSTKIKTINIDIDICMNMKHIMHRMRYIWSTCNLKFRTSGWKQFEKQ